MRKPLEPFMFTLGIFWQHIWSNLAAWRILVYIKNNPYSLFTPEQIKEGNLYWKDHQLLHDHPRFVSDSRSEFHAQFWVGVAEDIMNAQKFARDMLFKLPWLGCKSPLFKVEMLVLFIMGDTLAHDKLCGLQISTKAQLICQMCNTPKDKFCDPEHPYTLWDSQILQKHLVNK